MIKIDGFRATLQKFHESMESKILVILFLMDSKPHYDSWQIGFSGGKFATCFC